jgi:rhodanese-related sulfurtransferase
MKRLLCLLAAGIPVLGAELQPCLSQGTLVSPEMAAGEVGEGVQILDLRPKADWDKGHLPKSKQLTLADENFTEKVKAMMNPAKPLLIYCRSGRCSPKAAKLLREAGFSHVDELDGGMDAWEQAGRPVER